MPLFSVETNQHQVVLNTVFILQPYHLCLLIILLCKIFDPRGSVTLPKYVSLDTCNQDFVKTVNHS